MNIIKLNKMKTSSKNCHYPIWTCILVILVTCNSLVVTVFGQGGNVTATRRLKIVIPVTNEEFVSISKDPVTGEQKFGGFSIEVFRAIVNTALTEPVTFDFYPFVKPDGSSNGSYDKMLQAVFDKEYDGMVGDTTLRFYRTRWVDFTYPYTETGITMLVPTNPNPNRKVTQIKVIPLIKGLVSATLAFCFISALLFWFVEYKNHKNKMMTGSAEASIDGTSPDLYSKDNDNYWHKETLKAIIHTRLVMVMWFLVLLFLTACYTASLSSLLTAQQHKTPVKTISEMIRTRANVGYPTGSFVVNTLKERGFSNSQLHGYSSDEEMLEMLAKGSNPGGVVALIDEIPYLQLFLSKQCNNDYTLVPSVNLPAGGFGFAFQKGSALASEVSNGILKVMDSGQIATIEEQTIGGPDKKCSEDEMSTANSDSSLLDTDTLWILFAGAIGVAILVIILYFVYLGTYLDAFRKRFAFPCYMLSGQDRHQ